MKALHSLDSKQIRTDTTDVGTHAVQHVAQLLDVWFAGGIVDGCDTFSQYRGHDDVCSTGNRCLVQQHVCSFQPFGPYLVDIAFGNLLEFCTQVFESQEVSVQPTAPNLIAARFRHDGLTHSSQQRTNHQDRTA